MIRIRVFAAIASVVAIMIVLAVGTSFAQTTAKEEKAAVKVKTQEKVASEVKVMNQQKTAEQTKAANQIRTREQAKVANQEKLQKWGAFDDDGDGILNHEDPDYVRPKDGTGKKLGKAHGGKGMYGNRAGYGQGSGGMTGGGSGSGTCDGTGPKGKGRGR